MRLAQVGAVVSGMMGVVVNQSHFRVRPLQLQWQSGRVGQVPGVHSPPARRHRLGVRGHAGTTASSKGRKWAGLPSRHHTLSSVSVSQEP